jgi:ABC-2 type transport system permease protein
MSAEPVRAADARIAAARPVPGWTGEWSPAAGGPVSTWLRFFGSELALVFGRVRNLALLGALAAVPVLFGIVFRLTESSMAGPGGPNFLNQLAGNGVFLALVVLELTLTVLLLPLATAVVAGESIAGEAGLGTLRGLLIVPAGRTRLLAVKYAAIAVFSLTGCLLVAVMSLIMGMLLFPSGPVTLLSGNTIPLWDGVVRVLVLALYTGAAMISLGAIGLAASTLTQHAVGAIAGLLVLVVGSEICDLLPSLSAIHPFLPTHFWLDWDGLFTSPTDWSSILHGLVSFVVYAVIFVAFAWAKLTSADITS